MTQACQQCGHPNPAGNAFCGGCGTPLAAQQSFTQATATHASYGALPQRPSWAPHYYTRPQRVGIILGVLFIPYIVAWVTLRKGFSNTARAVSFAWMFGVICMLALSPAPERKDRAQPASAVTASTPQPTPELTAVEKLVRAKRLAAGEGDKASLGEAVDLLHGIPKDSKEFKEARPLLEQTTKRWSKLAAADMLLGPKPENSAWDGRVACADGYLRTTLNDYDSSEYLEWSPVTRVDLKGEPYWAVRLKLRAKNAFGAFIVRDVYFLIRQNQVVRVEGL